MSWWHVTGGGDEKRRGGGGGGGQWRDEWGRESEKKMSGFFPVFFSRFLPFLHVFLYFEIIFGDFLAIFSQHALFFYLTFSPFEIFTKKYFREFEWGVFTPFLENGTIFVSQGRFSKFFRGVFFFLLPHISPSGAVAVFFLA
jgi:hypothetical protein